MLPPFLNRKRGKFEWLHDEAKGPPGDGSLTQTSQFGHSKYYSQRSSAAETVSARVEKSRDVVVEVEKFVATELHARGCGDAALPSVARLQVFEEAMEKFLARQGGGSTSRSFLDAYRKEQAALRQVYVDRVAEIPRLRARVEAAQTRADASAELAREQATARAAELAREVEVLTRRLAAADADRDRAVVDLETRTARYRNVMEDADDLQRASKMLTVTIARLEEEKERWAQQDNSHKSDLLNLRSALEKVHGEFEKAKVTCADLEEKLKAERAEKARDRDVEVTNLRNEVLATTVAHRDLQVKFHKLLVHFARSNRRLAELEMGTTDSAAAFLSKEDLEVIRDDEAPLAVFSAPSASSSSIELLTSASKKAASADQHRFPTTMMHLPGGGSPSGRGHITFAAAPEATSSSAAAASSSSSSSSSSRGGLAAAHYPLPPRSSSAGAVVLAPDTNVLAEPYVPPGAFFEALGTGPEVPVYLKTDSRVKNWSINKRATERMITDVWLAKERAQQARSASDRERLAPYLHSYLVGRFRSQAAAVEWGYNLLDGLRRYVSDSDCRLFLDILNGELHEEVRIDQLTMLVEVMRTMTEEDVLQSEDGRTPTGYVSVTNFMEALRGLLPTKPEHSFARLQRQLQLETELENPSMVDYQALLESDAEGNQGDFCELLREQHLAEIMQFTQHIAAQIRAAAQHHGSQDMPLSKFRGAIIRADPDMPRAKVNAYIVRGAQCQPKDIIYLELHNKTVNAEAFIKQLCASGLLKQSKPRRSLISTSVDDSSRAPSLMTTPPTA